jgi:hypothetical protein
MSRTADTAVAHATERRTSVRPLTLSPDAGARGPEEEHDIAEFSRERQTERLLDLLTTLTTTRQAGDRR